MTVKKSNSSKRKSEEIPTKTVEANLPPKMVPTEDYKSIYANFVVAAYSPFDIALMIGEAVGGDEQGRQIVHQKVRVTMAPAEAKVVMFLLANTLKSFEEQFGEVKVPENQVPSGWAESTVPTRR
jgi:hypothetical protein